MDRQTQAKDDFVSQFALLVEQYQGQKTKDELNRACSTHGELMHKTFQLEEFKGKTTAWETEVK